MIQCNGHHTSIIWLSCKASKVLNFIKRNLSNHSSATKASAYISLVCLIMENASCVWDTHEIINVQALKKVQRWEARWFLSEYGRHSSVTRMLAQLGWPTLLQHCRFMCRIVFFIKLLVELSLWHSRLISCWLSIPQGNTTANISSSPGTNLPSVAAIYWNN